MDVMQSLASRKIWNNISVFVILEICYMEKNIHLYWIIFPTLHIPKNNSVVLGSRNSYGRVFIKFYTCYFSSMASIPLYCFSTTNIPYNYRFISSSRHELTKKSNSSVCEIFQFSLYKKKSYLLSHEPHASKTSSPCPP